MLPTKPVWHSNRGKIVCWFVGATYIYSSSNKQQKSANKNRELLLGLYPDTKGCLVSG